MKKVVAAVVVLGIVGGGVAWAVTRTPERRLCVKMGDLCGVEGDFSDYEDCVEGIAFCARSGEAAPVLVQQ